MKAEREDQLHQLGQRKGFPLIRILLVVIVVAGLIYYWWSGDSQETTESVALTPAAEQAVPRVELPPAPDIPRAQEMDSAPAQETESTEEVVEQVVESLPTPEESDVLLREQLGIVGVDGALEQFVAAERPLEVSAALIDGLGQGVILRKILPAEAPREAFSVSSDGDELYMSEQSYDRYDTIASTVAALDSEVVAQSFHTLRPLYERAYASMGLDADDFDNAVIRTLDLILATPEIEQPIALVRKSVMYNYADAQLEAMPSVQKQLLRMGPDNIRLIKRQARELREALLAQ